MSSTLENRVLVYSTQQDYLAHLIKGLLEEEDIDVILLNQKDSAYQIFGYFELYVHPSDEERAKKIIAERNE